MDGRHPPQSRVEDMAAHYISEIMTVQPTGPYLLGGRCFGGLVAFEMAQQLRVRGQHVALLAILDTLQPPKPPWLRDQTGSDQEAMQGPLRRMSRSSAQKLYLTWKRLTITDAFAVYTLKQYNGWRNLDTQKAENKVEYRSCENVTLPSSRLGSYRRF